MPIIVDSNAAEDAVYHALVECVPCTSRRRLDIGDIHLIGKKHSVLVERKTWSDLAASMSDGRLNEQKRRFVETRGVGEHLFYMIEVADFTGRSGYTQGVSNEALNAWILKTMIRDNIAVIRTTKKQDTISTLLYLHSQLERETLFKNSSSASTSHASALATAAKRKRANLEGNPMALYVHMLSTLPGMSVQKATRVSVAFPSFTTLVCASEEALACVSVGTKRLGPALAKRLKSLC